MSAKRLHHAPKGNKQRSGDSRDRYAQRIERLLLCHQIIRIRVPANKAPESAKHVFSQAHATQVCATKMVETYGMFSIAIFCRLVSAVRRRRGVCCGTAVGAGGTSCTNSGRSPSSASSLWSSPSRRELPNVARTSATFRTVRLEAILSAIESTVCDHLTKQLVNGRRTAGCAEVGGGESKNWVFEYLLR